MDTEQRTILERIKAKVIATHWIKESYKDTHQGGRSGKVHYCLVGMINHEQGREPTALCCEHLLNDDPLAASVWAAIKTLHPGTKATMIEDWNDRSRTTRADVVAVLDEALKNA